MKRFPLPDKSTPLLEADGRTVNQAWFDFFKYLEQRGLSDLFDLKLTSLANNEVLIWNSADSKWENGAN